MAEETNELWAYSIQGTNGGQTETQQRALENGGKTRQAQAPPASASTPAGLAPQQAVPASLSHNSLGRGQPATEKGARMELQATSEVSRSELK